MVAWIMCHYCPSRLAAPLLALVTPPLRPPPTNRSPSWGRVELHEALVLRVTQLEQLSWVGIKEGNGGGQLERRSPTARRTKVATEGPFDKPLNEKSVPQIPLPDPPPCAWTDRPTFYPADAALDLRLLPRDVVEVLPVRAVLRKHLLHLALEVVHLVLHLREMRRGSSTSRSALQRL